MRLIQVAQHADDLGRAAAFYEKLTGTAPTGLYDPPGLLFFDLDGVRLLLDRAAPSAYLYLSVESVRDAVQRVREEVEIVTEPQVIFHHDDDALGPAGNDEWQAFLLDSEGNTVGLISWEPPEQ